MAGASRNCGQTDLLVVIVCYRVTELTIDCLRSLSTEIHTVPNSRVAICENGTGAESVLQLEEAIAVGGWGDWVSLTPIYPNRGFAGGNNVILREALGWPDPPRYFLLLNADTFVRPGALSALVAAAEQNPEAGIVAPRLEWEDGTPQQSCFRDLSPIDELFTAARTGPLAQLFKARELALPVSDAPLKPAWISFACALLRREVFAQVGLLDEGFYLYFDDSDYCRRAEEAGWTVLHWPQARVVHLRGRSNPVKSLTAQRKRRPAYWYASRARYYAKFYGRGGLWAANLFWLVGRSISLARELIGNKEPHTCEREWLDIWANWWDPLKRRAPTETRCSRDAGQTP